MDLIKEFNANIYKYKSDLCKSSIVVGVSCGIDSSVLLDLLEKSSQKYGFEVIVAHVNHKRRAESEKEEAYIRSYCENKHKLYVKELEYEADFVPSFQEYARIKRLEFFFEVMDKENAKFLFLAHHLNDDIETSLMHFIRGGSLDSIKGLSLETIINNKVILRPLINVLKDDLYEYAKKENVKFFEDSTNNTNDYTRNRIRHNIVSAIFEENPSFGDNFLSYKEKISYASALINEKRDNFIKENVNTRDNIEFYSDKLQAEANVMQDEILFEVLKKYKLSKANIKEIKKIIFSNKKNLIINYKDLSIIKEDNKITIKNDLYQKEEYEVLIDSLGTYKINDEVELSFENLDNISRNKDLCISNVDIIWYNTSMFPFKVRTRKQGDKMLLSSGHKKVKDLLIDEHLNMIDKDKTLLLLDKDDNILCVIGVKKSQILSKSTDNNLLIKINRRTK